MTPEQINLKAVIACKNWYFNLNDKRLASEFMTDFALSIADELQWEAFKAGLGMDQSYFYTEDEIESLYQDWKEKQQ